MYLHISHKYRVVGRNAFLGGSRLRICEDCCNATPIKTSSTCEYIHTYKGYERISVCSDFKPTHLFDEPWEN